MDHSISVGHVGSVCHGRLPRLANYSVNLSLDLLMYIRVFHHVEQGPAQCGRGGLSSSKKQVQSTHDQVELVKASLWVMQRCIFK
uniref:Uncharacterized protein n=1 Tax=Anguilla anguilla TaxID=7936 RepID=A0A0E9P9N3_ANGAN